MTLVANRMYSNIRFPLEDWNPNTPVCLRLAQLWFTCGWLLFLCMGNSLPARMLFLSIHLVTTGQLPLVVFNLHGIEVSVCQCL